MILLESQHKYSFWKSGGASHRCAQLTTHQSRIIDYPLWLKLLPSRSILFGLSHRLTIHPHPGCAWFMVNRAYDVEAPLRWKRHSKWTKLGVLNLGSSLYPVEPVKQNNQGSKVETDAAI